jgi:hypothetical protein
MHPETVSIVTEDGAVSSALKRHQRNRKRSLDCTLEPSKYISDSITFYTFFNGFIFELYCVERYFSLLSLAFSKMVRVVMQLNSRHQRHDVSKYIVGTFYITSVLSESITLFHSHRSAKTLWLRRLHQSTRFCPTKGLLYF